MKYVSGQRPACLSDPAGLAEAGYLRSRTRVADGFHPPGSLERTERAGEQPCLVHASR